MKEQIEIIANARIRFFRKCAELWHYRSLLFELSKRDFKTRYAQTFLGLAWAVINPVLSVLLLYFVFGIVVKADTQGVPPLLFVMCGICAWNFFSRLIGDAGHSIISASAIVKKIYFPRLIIPVSKSIVGLVDLGIVLILLGALLIYFQHPVSWRLLWLIPITLITALSGLAFGIWVSALSIRYRDFTQIVPVLLRIGMFLSPIGYGLSSVPEQYHWWYKLNPASGLIEGFRSCILNTPLDWDGLFYSVSISLVVLISGMYYFFRLDKYIGDIL
jgi:lipopolysaccharide transport system permease protein